MLQGGGGKSLAAGGIHLFLLSVLVFFIFIFGQLPRQLLRAVQEVARSLIKLTANASWQLILSAAQKYLGERPSVARAVPCCGHMEMPMNVVYGIYVWQTNANSFPSYVRAGDPNAHLSHRRHKK